MRGGLRWQLAPAADGRVDAAVPDRTLTLPGTCEAALRAAAHRRGDGVGDLPGLDDDADRLVLARRLLRRRSLVPA